MSFFALKSISLAALAALHLLPDRLFVASLYIAVGMGHYLVSAYYARKPLRRLMGAPRTYPGLLALVGLGFLNVQYSMPDIVYFFAVHHALTDAYLFHPLQSSLPRSRSSLLTASRIVGIAGLQIFLIRGSLFPDPSPAIWTGLHVLLGLYVATLAVQAVVLLRSGRDASRSLITGTGLFELPNLLLVAVSYQLTFDFNQLVFYHFIFWVAYPLFDLRFGKRIGPLEYFSLTAVATAVFFVFTPYGLFTMSSLLGRVPVAPLRVHDLMFWGYLHITLSFAVSQANPRWILRLFATR